MLTRLTSWLSLKRSAIAINARAATARTICFSPGKHLTSASFPLTLASIDQRQTGGTGDTRGTDMSCFATDHDLFRSFPPAVPLLVRMQRDTNSSLLPFSRPPVPLLVRMQRDSEERR